MKYAIHVLDLERDLILWRMENWKTKMSKKETEKQQNQLDDVNKAIEIIKQQLKTK